MRNGNDPEGGACALQGCPWQSRRRHSGLHSLLLLAGGCPLPGLQRESMHSVQQCASRTPACCPPCLTRRLARHVPKSAESLPVLSHPLAHHVLYGRCVQPLCMRGNGVREGRSTAKVAAKQAAWAHACPWQPQQLLTTAAAEHSAAAGKAEPRRKSAVAGGQARKQIPVPAMQAGAGCAESAQSTAVQLSKHRQHVSADAPQEASVSTGFLWLDRCKALQRRGLGAGRTRTQRRQAGTSDGNPEHRGAGGPPANSAPGVPATQCSGHSGTSACRPSASTRATCPGLLLG